jgi:hypothetical protein
VISRRDSSKNPAVHPEARSPVLLNLLQVHHQLITPSIVGTNTYHRSHEGCVLNRVDSTIPRTPLTCQFRTLRRATRTANQNPLTATGAHTRASADRSAKNVESLLAFSPTCHLFSNRSPRMVSER